MNIFRHILLLSFLTGTALLLRCSSNPVSSQQATVNALQTRVNAIMSDVEKIRGLNFIRPVFVGTITQKSYSAQVTEQVTASLSKAEEEGLSKEYAQMGFLTEATEADTPLTTILINYYSNLPIAYYIPGTDSLYIISESVNLNDPNVAGTIAHELTHALQDQNLDMKPTIFPGYSQYNSDASLAQTSLIEGDALFTEFAYDYSVFYKNSTIALFDSALSLADHYKTELLTENYPMDFPVFLDVKGYAPYFLGSSYVGQKYVAAYSWNGVNSLYSISSVPRSSAEINGSQIPIWYFEFNALQNVLVSQTPGIEFADDDNAGFGLLLGLFYGDLDPVRAGRSLDWRGDRYTFVKRTGQTYGTLVWSMAFANADAARYLFGMLDLKIRGRLLGGLSATVDSLSDSVGTGITYTYSSDAISTKLRRIDNQVWWLENTGALTQQIMDILSKQQTSPTLAKSGSLANLPVTLSAGTKKNVVDGLMRHLFRD